MAEKITQWFVQSIGENSDNVDQYLIDGMTFLGLSHMLNLFYLSDGTKLQLRWVNSVVLGKLKGSDFRVWRDYLVYYRHKDYGPVFLDETVYGKRKSYSKPVQKIKDQADALKEKKK